MFCCRGTEEDERNKEIAAFLNKTKRKELSKVKLLLLGAGESGKSTIFKQMKILYANPPTTEERQHYTQVVHNNCYTYMAMLLEQAATWGLVDFEDASHPLHAGYNTHFSPDARRAGPQRLTPEMGAYFRLAWDHPAIKATWKRRNETQIVESMSHFFDQIERICAVDYLADSQDYLFTRVRTTGVVTETYELDHIPFEMYDVGGQRNERRKWIHCFSNVTAVIFVAALSEYDQCLFEDSSVNRMDEALMLFEEIAGLQCFEGSAILLFLNKVDLFEAKLATNPIAQVENWRDYQGTTSEQGIEYFKNKFLERRKNLRMYCYPTTATNTANVQYVFEVCKDVILDRNITQSGF